MASIRCSLTTCTLLHSTQTIHQSWHTTLVDERKKERSFVHGKPASLAEEKKSSACAGSPTDSAKKGPRPDGMPAWIFPSSAASTCSASPYLICLTSFNGEWSIASVEPNGHRSFMSLEWTMGDPRDATVRIVAIHPCVDPPRGAIPVEFGDHWPRPQQHIFDIFFFTVQHPWFRPTPVFLGLLLSQFPWCRPVQGSRPCIVGSINEERLITKENMTRADTANG